MCHVLSLAALAVLLFGGCDHAADTDEGSSWANYAFTATSGSDAPITLTYQCSSVAQGVTTTRPEQTVVLAPGQKTRFGTAAVSMSCTAKIVGGQTPRPLVTLVLKRNEERVAIGYANDFEKVITVSG